MLGKFLDPKNDIAFKKIFGNEKNKDILIHFLNDILLCFEGKDLIQEITFLKPIQDPEIVSKKTSIVDILCTDSKGIKYIVEMQVAKIKGFEKRAQYYASKAYSSQANKNDKYHDLKAIIFLAIADFIMFPSKKEYQSNHVILDKKSYEQDLKDFSFTFIELPKFNKKLKELSTIQEKWCYFFKHAKNTSPVELKKLIGKDVILEKAYHELDSAFWTEKELVAYEQAEKKIKDYVASMEQKFDEGKALGIALGITEGITKGIAEGITKGKAEGIALGITEGITKGMAEGITKGKAEGKVEIAIKLLKKKYSINDITELTGLSSEEIQKIKKKSGS